MTLTLHLFGFEVIRLSTEPADDHDEIRTEALPFGFVIPEEDE